MSAELYREMASYIDSKLEFVTATRQDFHKHAESGWHEIRTCSLIADHLIKLGYTKVLMGREALKAEARMGLPDQEELDYVYQRALEQGAVPEYAEKFKDGFTGIVAILETGRPGPVIGFRQDIDALGVFECKDPAVHRPAREGFASINDGEMHACGHDAHATIGMTVADVLMKYKDQLNGTVKLVFQPAEEGVRGAKAIAETGILDDVDYMFGVHMWSREEGGDDQIGFSYNESMANAKIDVLLHGNAAHATQPELGNNAMLAAGHIILGIYGIPRTSLGDSKINIGMIQGGSGRNVICDRVKLVMELRGHNQAALGYIYPYARKIIEHSAAMHGCTSEIKLMGETYSLFSDVPEFVDEIVAFSKSMGFRTTGPKKGDASDDYSTMCKRVQEHGGKSMSFTVSTEVPAPFHSTKFDLQEKDILTGVKFECAACLHLMGLLP